ncbi:MAG: Lon protease family protein, partial [Porticoccaceae bacterium]
APGRNPLARYEVNLLLDRTGNGGAPIIYEEHPSYANLLGRIEHTAYMGALSTDFTLIKPGALHRANGGYLILDAIKLLMQPYAWEALKQALSSRELRIESLEQALSLVSTVSLEPQPIPLDVKVILLGDRRLYYLLYAQDPDFAELFKVPADFESAMPRSPDNDLLYARMIATIVRQKNLLPFDRAAVAAIIQQSMRVEADSTKLSTHMRSIADLITEADYWAREAGHPVVGVEDVHRVVTTQINRVDQVRDHIHESIQREIILIDTEGASIGQVNGLSVLQLGNFSFGQPSRITCTTRLGDGHVIDIERETAMGGPIHTKGVFILSSFLGARYGQNAVLSLTASLTFEQSYGGVDGDSASLAELCALLSSISQIPIRQCFAMTGSINQFGQVQVIGGINEKVEGFFDVCKARGLRGNQGVLLPRSNIQHLLPRPDVVAAMTAGEFHLYPVDSVDEAIEILTGIPAGTVDGRGDYPPETVNGRVLARLKQFAERRGAFTRGALPRGEFRRPGRSRHKTSWEK